MRREVMAFKAPAIEAADDGLPMLESVSLKGYKSFRELDVPLGIVNFASRITKTVIFAV